MAKHCEPTSEQIEGWKEWVAARPDNVRKAAERLDPWTLYRLKDTGQRATLYILSEAENGDVTGTVNITGEFK